MRVLIGGLIGAAVSAAAWFGLEYATGREFGWLAIAVGVATGMCVNAAAGAGAAASYGRAALAVMLTMLALVGGRVVYAQIMRSVSQVTTVVPGEDLAAAEATEQEAQEAVGATAGDAAAPAERTPLDFRGAGGLTFQKPKATTMSEFDMLWMGLAALMAYFFGKGSGKPAPIVTETSMPEGAAPA
jgi:hypothetical protein